MSTPTPPPSKVKSQPHVVRKPLTGPKSTADKMIERYGTLGTPDEYRDTTIFGEIQPVIAPNAPSASKATKSRKTKVQHTAYLRALQSDRPIRREVKAWVFEHWWDNICRSADREELYPVLFERWMFNEDGTLDKANRAYQKVGQQLAVVYMHITTKYPESDLDKWVVRFELYDGVGAFVQAQYPVQGEEARFGVTPPKAGFFSHGVEVSKLRRDRDAGKNFKIPEGKKGYNKASQIAAPNSDKVSSTITAEASGTTPVSMVSTSPGLVNYLESPEELEKANRLAEYEATSTEDWEDWGEIVEHETELLDEWEGGDNLFEEAKENSILPAEKDRYVYKKEDAKLPKKAWLW